ncbi:polysaccharide biosynthesis/export family protein [Oceanibium sediminis]|uniref:polysaccharide biosynthesis/export family protein n=1 Tax=Oceanibium sediminis TaxID=2026339 RepID=UPI001300734F|nr:polysaccharide biosynthesis/export family protein [Oceanibium sediminis]
MAMRLLNTARAAVAAVAVAPLAGPGAVRLCAMLVILVAALGVGRGAAQDAGYRLMVNDRIQLQVVEWRAEIGTPQTWEALSRAYTVDTSGRISVPLVGEIAAAGLTTQELGDTVATRLQKVVGLVDPPGTSVEVVAYNPVIVTGAVLVAGAHPYSPGMTVSKAYALAGGAPRAAEGEIRASTVTAGAIARAQETLARQLAREARLIAERDGSDTIDFPNLLGHPGGIAAEVQIKDTEIAVFESRRARLQREVGGVEDLHRLYAAEEESLLKKRISLDTIIALTETRLGQLEDLSESGLVRGQQLLDSQRAMGDLRTQSLNIDLALFRARAQLSTVSRERIAIEANRSAEIEELLAQTRTEITAQRRELETNRNVLATYADDVQVQAALGANTDLRFELQQQGETRARTVAPTARMMPGDVLTVLRVAPRGTPEEAATGQRDSPRYLPSEPSNDATFPTPPLTGRNL